MTISSHFSNQKLLFDLKFLEFCKLINKSQNVYLILKIELINQALVEHANVSVTDISLTNLVAGPEQFFLMYHV